MRTVMWPALDKPIYNLSSYPAFQPPTNPPATTPRQAKPIKSKLAFLFSYVFKFGHKEDKMWMYYMELQTFFKRDSAADPFS